MNNEKQKGIWIPDEILGDKRLSLGEKVLLSIYKNYTINGSEHCCLITNNKLGELINITDRQIRNYKQHLKDLDLIETNGGIKVWYKGYQNDTHDNDDKNQGVETDFRHNSADDTEGGNTLPGGGNEFPSRAETDFRHNKEKEIKEKKENKGTIEHMSNTYNKSTSKGDDDEDEEDLEYMEKYGIGKLSYILQHNNYWLPALQYLEEHPTKTNYDKIEAYWANNDEYLEYLHNFNNNTLRITV